MGKAVGTQVAFSSFSTSFAIKACSNQVRSHGGQPMPHQS